MACTTQLLLFLAVVQIGISFELCLNGIKGKYAEKRLEGHQYKVLYPMGKLLCQRECSLQKNCVSINFKQNDQRCELNTHASTSLTESPGWEYIEMDQYLKFDQRFRCSNSCPNNTICVPLTKGGFTCVKTECYVPETIPHGMKITSNTAVGKSTSYSCDQHYEMIGGGNITCKANMEHTPIDFYCSPKPCGSPPVVANGYVVSQNTSVGGKAQYACKYGYRLKGENSVTCRLGQNWSAVSFYCELIVCPNPPAISNGYVSYKSGNTLGSLTKYACNFAYFIVNGDTIYCQADSRWSYINFSCKLIGIF